MIRGVTMSKKMTRLSMITAIGIVLHVVESLLPPLFPVPGAKFGFANVVNLVALAGFGVKSSFIVAVLRVFIGSLLGGTFLTTSFFLSASGALASVFTMATAYTGLKRYLSVVSISILGSIAHNMAQLYIASIIIQSRGIFLYLPYLLLLSIPTGILTGLTAHYLIKRVGIWHN